MAATIPETEPEFIQAGDTLKFTRTLSDYPAGTWTLTYYLKKQTSDGTKYNFAATADGTTHSVNVSAATTAAWGAGSYTLTGKVSDGTDTKTVFGPLPIEVFADPNAAGDERSHNEKVLASLRAAFETAASYNNASMTVEGQQFQFVSKKDWIDAINFYEAKVNADKDAERVRAGKPSQRRILTRFRRPS